MVTEQSSWSSSRRDPAIVLSHDAVLGERLAECDTIAGALSQKQERPLACTESPHEVVDAAWAESGLRDGESGPSSRGGWVQEVLARRILVDGVATHDGVTLARAQATFIAPPGA